MRNYFIGKVLDGGFSCKEWYNWLANNENRRIEVFAEPIGNKRSDQANRYFWGVVVNEISRTTGFTEDEVHEFIEEKFADRKWVKIGREEKLVKRTCSTLKRSEFQELLLKVQHWALEELGITWQEEYEPTLRDL